MKLHCSSRFHRYPTPDASGLGLLGNYSCRKTPATRPDQNQNHEEARNQIKDHSSKRVPRGDRPIHPRRTGIHREQPANSSADRRPDQYPPPTLEQLGNQILLNHESHSSNSPEFPAFSQSVAGHTMGTLPIRNSLSLRNRTGWDSNPR
jgi:hypothetical protein